jgi:hypothetical protein
MKQHDRVYIQDADTVIQGYYHSQDDTGLHWVAPGSDLINPKPYPAVGMVPANDGPYPGDIVAVSDYGNDWYLRIYQGKDDTGLYLVTHSDDTNEEQYDWRRCVPYNEITCTMNVKLGVVTSDLLKDTYADLSSRVDLPTGIRIVCAANRYSNGRIILGVRHFDALMIMQLEADLAVPWRSLTPEQGFICNRRQFHTRKEAWAIASNAGQIIRRCDGDDHKLFSENLY